jgi:signal transduction histidine kinase
MIFQAGHHLLDLINEVLDLSKIEAGKLTLAIDKVRWREVLSQCLELVQPAAEKAAVQLIDETANAALPERVRADHMRFRQVLLNLLSNAVKYNRRNGSITVTAQLVLKDRLRISVRDTGHGLDAKQVASLFQPFNRLDAEGGMHEGVGIGLVISKRLMELMDGNIHVESLPGEGSVFSVELNTVEA